MREVRFGKINSGADESLRFVVIVTSYKGRWVFVRHKERRTWELPGGHIEPGEKPDDAAVRELWEETGILDAAPVPICDYSYTDEEHGRGGRLYYFEAEYFSALPETSEIGSVKLFSGLPEELTYPEIQPCLFEKCLE